MKSIDSHFSTPISNYHKIKKSLNNVNDCVGIQSLGFNLESEQKIQEDQFT